MVSFTTNALSSALAGLNVSQQLLDLTSQNIANAQTAGYTAKTLQVETLTGAGQSIGVLTGNIQRNVSTALQSSVWTQNAAAGASSTVSSALSNLQSLNGTTGSGTDFSTYLTTLKGDFTQLSGSPNSTALQTQAVSDAQTFATSLNTASTAVTKARNDAEANISDTVTSINGELKTIAALNTQIAQQSASGQSTADLEDQRDDAIGTLSSQINITTYAGSNGMVVVQTPQGQILADSQAHSLVFQQQSLGTTSSYPTTVSGVYVDSTSGTDLAKSPVTLGGTLGGLLQLRDQILPQQQAQLDEVAEQTSSRFNTQNMTLFTDGLGNVPATSPASGYAGLAGTIQVNPAVVASPSKVQQGTSGPAIDASDNTVIDNVLNYTFGLNQNASGTPNVAFNTTGLGPSGTLSTTDLPPVATLETYAQDAIASQASTSSTYTAQASYDANYSTSLTTSLQNADSVNLDTEVAKLTVYENSYSCAAQVVTTEQKLMSDLLSVVGGS